MPSPRSRLAPASPYYPFMSLTFFSLSALELACSRRSDSGERCEVKVASFTSHHYPLSERLEQATLEPKKQRSKKKKLLISGYASRVASIFHLGKIEATLLAGYARGPNPPPSPSFFGTRAGLPSFLPLICIILFLSLSAHGSEERKDDRSWYCVGRLLSMNHLMSRVLPKFNESPRHLIELSVRFEPSFLAEMLSKSHYSLK